jgi:hypothetical protein
MKETDFPIAFESFVTPKGVWFHSLGLMIWKQVRNESDISLYRTLYFLYLFIKFLKTLAAKKFK